MKSLRQIFLILTLIGFYQVNAQQVLKTDTLSGNVVTMSMDKKISELLDSSEDNCDRTSRSDSGYNNSSNTSTTYTPTRIVVPERTLTNAEICRRNPRIMGFKIQVAVVKSNKEADEVGLYFRRRYPSMKVEKDASLRPNYKILAGSYFSKQTANSDFNNVRKTFKDARLIPYRVFCVEAK